MSRELIHPEGLHPSPGFSHVAIASGDRMICFAGQLALAEDFSVIGAGDLAEQTRASMRNLETAMRAVDIGWDEIVRRTIYTLHPTEFETITEAMEEVMGSDRHPAQTVLGVTGLALPGLLIEIEATAIVSS